MTLSGDAPDLISWLISAFGLSPVDATVVVCEPAPVPDGPEPVDLEGVS